MGLELKLFLLSLVLIVVGQTPVVRPIRAVAGRALDPLSISAYHFGVGTAKHLSLLSYWGNVLEENRRLREELSDLKSELSQLKEVSRENRLLRRQLRVSSEKNYDLLAVRVSGWEDVSVKDYLLIRGGKSLGIKPGMPVVVGNFLLGRVESVTGERSRVQLILSPGLRIFALDQDSKDRAKGVVRGYPPGKLLMERILPEEVVHVGDTVIASGENEGIPFGLVLGEVERVLPGEGGLLKRAVLRVGLDFSHLEEVFVLR